MPKSCGARTVPNLCISSAGRQEQLIHGNFTASLESGQRLYLNDLERAARIIRKFGVKMCVKTACVRKQPKISYCVRAQQPYLPAVINAGLLRSTTLVVPETASYTLALLH